MRRKSGQTLTLIAKGFLVDGLAQRPYNTHIDSKEHVMQAMVNLTIVMMPVIVMLVAMIIKGEF